ncbi:hypothetical protein ALC57_05882, partial [Trachymyrmex cornetzi]
NNPNNIIIKRGLKDLNKFVNEHPDILVTRADKGNTTVILNRDDYEGRLKSFEPHHEDGVTRQSHSGIIIVILTKDICDSCGHF